MSVNTVWKWSVKTYNPECFQQEVEPMIQEHGGSVTEVSAALGVSHYWVKLPAHILREQLNELVDLDTHATWMLERRGSFYDPE